MPKQQTTVDFVADCNKIHNNFYDYSLTVYTGLKSPVKIICPIHGLFEQVAKYHKTNKAGCPQCAGKNKTTQTIIDDFKKIHRNTYDYSNVVYQDMLTPVNILCAVHGEFQQLPRYHLNGSGCPQCAGNAKLDTSDFIEKSNIVHSGQYCYDKADYVGSHIPITITCPIHGEFLQRPNDHTNNGAGCPSCANHRSSGEREVSKYLTDVLNCVVEVGRRDIIPPLELDIYIPPHNIAIEYCGLYWHSDIHPRIDKHYHKTKHDMCQQRGIQLLTIFEDEWLDNKRLVKNKIENLLHLRPDSVYGRKTNVEVLDTKTKRHFFNNNHIQGDGPGSIAIGLRHKGELVACMSFSRHETRGWFYLTRYATTTRVVGGFSKLLRFFENTHDWAKIISFADLRWSDGNLYSSNGWVLDKTIPPDYYYSVKGRCRIHKSNYRRSKLRTKLVNFNPALTERENCDRAGLLRVWDCGKLRYTKTNDSTNGDDYDGYK
jgi:hypothetical protein